MASSNTPTTFGATIVPTPAKRADDEITLPPRVLDSPALTPAGSREDVTLDFSERRIPPHSPFYQHKSDSLERTHSRQNSKEAVVNEKDLEAGVHTPLSANEDNPFTSKVSVDCNKECRMWPSKQTLMQSRKAEKKKRRDEKLCGACCGPVVDFWARFTKRQKLFIKIGFGLFLIGAIVAIAVGISIAVNGTVYVSEGQQAPIPDPGDGS